MDTRLEELARKIRKYDMEPYRYFHRTHFDGLDWLVLMTKVGDRVMSRPVLYRNPAGLDRWLAEESIDELDIEVAEDGEKMLERTGALELFLSTFERQFEGNRLAAERVLEEVLEALQYLACQKLVLTKHGYLKD